MRRLKGILALALVGVPGAAMAAGYHYPELGSVALGRGGAFVARADDPTAIYSNPAGAARLRGTQILLNGTLLYQRTRFRRRQYHNTTVAPENYPKDATDQRMPEVVNNDAPFMAPFFAVSTDLGFLQRYDLVLIGGVYGPNAHPHVTFPRYCVPGTDPCQPTGRSGLPAPQRYDMVSTDVFVLYPSLGLAWRPLPQLSIGGVFQLGYASMDYQTVIGAAPAEERKYDIDVSVNGSSKLTPTGIIGVHARPLRWLEIGAVLRFGFTFNIDGDLCVGQHTSDGSCDLSDYTKSNLPIRFSIVPNPAPMRLKIPMATIVRTGVRYINFDARDRERFDIEVNLIWEGTSTLQSLDVRANKPIEVILASGPPAWLKVPGVNLVHGWKDSLSFRLGGSYRLYDLIKDATIVISAGGLYEPAVVPAEYTRLDFTPLTRLGFGLGVSLRWGRYDFTLGYARLFHLQRTIRPGAGALECGQKNAQRKTVVHDCGSQVRQIAPLLKGSSFGPAVGNGSFDVSIHEFTVGARLRFGEA